MALSYQPIQPNISGNFAQHIRPFIPPHKAVTLSTLKSFHYSIMTEQLFHHNRIIIPSWWNNQQTLLTWPLLPMVKGYASIGNSYFSLHWCFSSSSLLTLISVIPVISVWDFPFFTLHSSFFTLHPSPLSPIYHPSITTIPHLFPLLYKQDTLSSDRVIDVFRKKLSCSGK